MTAIETKIAQTKKEIQTKIDSLSLDELKIKFEIAVHSNDIAMMVLMAIYLKKWMGDMDFSIYADTVKATI